MKKNLSTIILVFILFVGLSLLLYPSISDYWNSLHQSKAISSYAEQVAKLDNDTYDQVWKDAFEYNSALLDNQNGVALSDAQKEKYEKQLNVGGNGVMGYVEIPSIKVSLPIYHGTDDTILQIAVGHIEWSSLPVGGESSHCVVSGHRGLPSAKLFTDLDKLIEGDIFILRVLDEVLTYEVDSILIVEPEDTKNLYIEPGEDYCTLVTCTPYGINSHRLLVRGHRVDNMAASANVRVTADAMQIEPVIVAPIVAMPMLIILLIILLIPKKGRKRGENTK